jgi:hypothetical protein
LKCVWLAIFLCAASLLPARELSDIMLYFFPATGGSPEEREFFDANLPNEIKDVHYKIVDNEDDADFRVFSTIIESGSPEGFSRFTLGLATIADSSPLLELSWDYANMEELYRWDIGSILAPAPPPAVSAAPLLPPLELYEAPAREQRWLYAGLRGGVSLGEYAFQLTQNYNPGYSLGISGEGGLLLELRLFRFLNIQAEGDFVYEVFEAPAEEGVHTFAFMSLMFPLVAKVPLEMGKFLVSLYAGAYYTMALGDAEKASNGATATVSVRTLDPLFGFSFTMGADMGFYAGPGEFFADVRYGKKLGTTVLEEGEGPLFTQDRVSVSFGYKIGLVKKRQPGGRGHGG